LARGIKLRVLLSLSLTKKRREMSTSRLRHGFTQMALRQVMGHSQLQTQRQ